MATKTLEQIISEMNTQLICIRAQQEAVIKVISSLYGGADHKKVLEIQNSINQLVETNIQRMKSEQGIS